MAMKNYIMFRCKECNAEFFMPRVHIQENTNYVGCPMDGRHNNTVVIGAYDNLNECMDHSSYKVEHGVVKQVR